MRGSNNGDNALVLMLPEHLSSGAAKLVRRFAEVREPLSNVRSVRPIGHALDSYQLLRQQLLR
jgi:hypothetical protein